ncbi:MAG TPA: CHAT domain-containing protein, partial [Terriglobales bacterium]
TLLRSGEAQLCASRDLTIDPETSFVIFARLRNQYVQWVLLPNGDLKQHSLLAAESIDRLSHLLTAMCAQPDSSVEAIANIAQQLSELLLPSEMGQDSSAIVFEPDGPLTQLPFRALRSRGQWLGLSNSVSVIPGLWAVKAGSLAEGVTSRLFLIGNSGDQRLELESESASANGYQTTKIANFLEIPERIDAAQLVYYVGHASEQQALQVALAVPRRLRICRFAVLAACRTRGTDSFEAGGFGILPDRLLQAGALAVVASRWDLDSEKTGQLLRPILKAGDSFTLSEELRDASRELAKAGVSHPYYWAGLDVYGVPTLKKGGYQ